MGMWLTSAEAGDTGTWGQQTPALPNQGRMLHLSLGLVKVILLPWESGFVVWGGQDEEDVPRLMVPAVMASPAPSCTLPTQEPRAS